MNPIPPPVEEAPPVPPPIARAPQAPEGGDQGNVSTATATLLAAADKASEARDHTAAITYLERAVRLEPRNADLWIKLSRSHLDDENYPAAIQHARKAIALASDNPLLRRAAWLQLADIKEAQGQTQEASAIRRQHQSLRG